MSKSHLRPCVGCERHIRVIEAVCPFCRLEQSAAFRAAPAPVAPRTRLTRAAMFALGTSTLAIATGCGSSSDATKTIDDGGNAGLDTGTDAPSSVAAYGGPGLPIDAGPNTPKDGGTQDFDALGGAAYGGPGQPIDEDAGDSGGNEMVDAAYGAVPFGDD